MNHIPHILIIDDNLLASKLVSFYLKELGYKCYYASNGKEALEFVSKYSFSLIICDLNMPVMDGYEFILSFRKMHEYDLIPIIIISSDDKEDNIVKILNSGADDFISKPLNEQIFISKIKATLQKSQLKKQSVQQLFEKQTDLSKTKILYCGGEDITYSQELLKNSQIEYVIVNQVDELFKILYSEKLNAVCLDENADWLYNIYQRFYETIKDSIPLIFIITEGKNIPQIDKNSCILYKHFPIEYNQQQLRFICTQQQKNKIDYIVSLKQAISNSSFVFDRYKELEYDSFQISILHENYDDMPGGDFYEVFSFNERYKLFFIGDIMGKSWSAWFYLPVYLAYIRSTIKFLISRNIKELVSAPEKILNMLNRYFAKDLQLSEVYTTLVLAVIDLQENRLIISTAGAVAPLYYNSQLKTVAIIPTTGVLMGIDVDYEYSKVEIPFNLHDIFMFYTDGYSESYNSETNEIIGKNGMKTVFESFVKNNMQTVLQFETEYLNHFKVQKFDDDRSLLIISRK